MKRFWIVLAALFTLSLAGIVVLWQGVQRFDMVVQADGDILYWIVQDDYPEQRDDSPFSWLLTGGGPTHIEVLRALETAAYDPAIKGVFLEVHALPASLGQVQELTEAIRRIRREGKPVEAWLSSAGNREYLLAREADVLTLAPEGHLVIPGLSAEMTFLAGTLDKLGMDADYVHVGRYKSAPESYERREPSEPHREMIDSLLDDQFDWLLGAVAEARGLERDTVRQLVDRGLFDAGAALSEGLVDAVGYLPDALADAFPTGETVDLDDYALVRTGEGRGPRVSLIHVTGTIVDGESSSGGWQGPSAGSWTVIDQLQIAYDDDDVAAVLLRIDSPGGSALASDLIWNEVQALRELKPVVVCMGGMAASGGYYVACAADSVFASGGTITGSIGVFAGKMDRSGFYEKIGVSRTFASRGRNALLYADESSFTDEQRKILSSQLEAFYGRFVDKVAAGRGLDRAQAAAAAEGRVWSGRQALEIGLVDGLGGFQRSQDALRSMLGIPRFAAINYGDTSRMPSFLERMLMKSLDEDRVSVPPSIAETMAAMGGLGPAAPMLDGRPLALHPVGIQLR